MRTNLLCFILSVIIAIALSQKAIATPPSGFAADGVIKSVDVKKSEVTFTVKHSDGARDYTAPIRPATKIEVDGKPAELKDLKAGMAAWAHIISKGDRYFEAIKAPPKK
ncbi:hypothetical protein [Humisphaera borealis]|uniref:DUF5666 domain-containing protein n=1 Tax=Humisphaera borealis TaxID=2807512 RepID=A0A7M2X2C8_9BACT|nr:hypothetical protein [Humisphaera borealis]QOV91211.1 hypothetical protein IPV69_07590 [Humisphaera borealis]